MGNRNSKDDLDARNLDRINQAADRLNREAEDTFEYQELGSSKLPMRAAKEGTMYRAPTVVMAAHDRVGMNAVASASAKEGWRRKVAG